MNRFAALLDRLAYEPSRNNKLRLITDYFRSVPDPDRGYALAALTGALSFQHAKAGLIRTLISERTRSALAELKAKGKKLGGIRQKTIEDADARAEALRPVLKEWEGKSANAIAKELNAREIKTPTGRPWHAMTVIRVKRRLAGGA